MTWWETALAFLAIAVVVIALVIAAADRLFNHVDVPEPEDETAPDPSAPGVGPPTCARCHDVGAVDERYCDCQAAAALRERIDADPRVQELYKEIERVLGDSEPRIMVKVDARTSVVHHRPRSRGAR